MSASPAGLRPVEEPVAVAPVPAPVSAQEALQVAVALLQMPADHPAALKGNYAGWTIPLEYQPVHDLFRDLKLPPYEQTSKFTLADAIRKYWVWLLLTLSALLVLALLTSWVFRLNRELKRAKETLETQHHLILDSVADGIFGVDFNGQATFVNRAMERITGWPAAELIGQNQHELLHHTRADGSPYPPCDCPIYAAFRDGTVHKVEDEIFWRKDGSAIPVEYTSTPIRHNGDLVGAEDRPGDLLTQGDEPLPHLDGRGMDLNAGRGHHHARLGEIIETLGECEVLEANGVPDTAHHRSFRRRQAGPSRQHPWIVIIERIG